MNTQEKNLLRVESWALAIIHLVGKHKDAEINNAMNDLDIYVSKVLVNDKGHYFIQVGYNSEFIHTNEYVEDGLTFPHTEAKVSFITFHITSIDELYDFAEPFYDLLMDECVVSE